MAFRPLSTNMVRMKANGEKTEALNEMLPEELSYTAIKEFPVKHEFMS